MPKFLMVETIHSEKVVTTRVGTTGTPLKNVDIGKAVKLIATDNFGLAALGDPIEGYLSTSNWDNSGTVDGFAIGGVIKSGTVSATFDGSQAAGTGAIAAGDYVVVGTVVAAGTALTGPLKVRKATDQAAAAASPFAARVVSLGTAGTGAVGTTGLIELL